MNTHPTPALIRERLGKRERLDLSFRKELRRAAVAVTILDDGISDPRVVIIKRSARHGNPGQWALPGGRIDAGETARQAAVRELLEETNLKAADAEVLGALDDFETSSGHLITPFVIWLRSAQDPVASPDEVQSIHYVPLGRFCESDIPSWRTDLDDRRLLFLPLGSDMRIHAPTGALLYQFASVALRGEEIRVNDLAQPDFTRS